MKVFKNVTETWTITPEAGDGPRMLYDALRELPALSEVKVVDGSIVISALGRLDRL